MPFPDCQLQQNGYRRSRQIRNQGQCTHHQKCKYFFLPPILFSKKLFFIFEELSKKYFKIIFQGVYNNIINCRCVRGEMKACTNAQLTTNLIPDILQVSSESWLLLQHLPNIRWRKKLLRQRAVMSPSSATLKVPLCRNLSGNLITFCFMALLAFKIVSYKEGGRGGGEEVVIYVIVKT